MNLLISVLGVLGILALVRRTARAAGRTLLRAAEAQAAAGVAANSARRGDLTAMQEGRELARLASRRRLRSGFELLLWSLWLFAPWLAGWGMEPYALASVLWMVSPRRGPATQRTEA